MISPASNPGPRAACIRCRCAGRGARPVGRSDGQRGVTLVELMVGLAIGLLVVAAAMVGLLASRGISGSVGDASAIQQQAAYALRVIGLQLRETGSLYLNSNPNDPGDPDNALAAVGFEIRAAAGNGFDLNDTQQIINGADGKLTLGHARYKVRTTDESDATGQSLARNCVGGPGDASSDARVESIFEFDAAKGQLKCGGNGAASQPVIDHVADFQVRYLLPDASSTALDRTMTYVAAGSVINWSDVRAVEVCLVLYGSEPVGMPGGSTYVGCVGADGNPGSIDMTDTAQVGAARVNRMHMTFRNVFQLRSAGLASVPL